MKVLYEGLEPDIDRYHFDFGVCTYPKGWAQIDTRQDASYFGQWVQPWKRRVMSYIEGDVRFLEFDSDQELADHLRAIAGFDGGAKIDAGGRARRNEFVHRLTELGLAELIH